jgi:hypothetical protein
MFLVYKHNHTIVDQVNKYIDSSGLYFSGTKQIQSQAYLRS